MDSRTVVLLTASERIADAVLATAAALRVGVDVMDDPAALAADWVSHEVVIVGGDQAAALAAFAPRRRERVYLAGFDAEQLVTWSVPLGAEAIGLPAGEPLVAGALAPRSRPKAAIVAVAGGHGGAGASTLAAGLAFAGTRTGITCALVDLDPHGGGIDLIVGAERMPGWRWPKLLAARGEVGDLREFLPSVDGVTLVSASRPVATERVTAPEPAAVESVVGALARHHDLVVLDVGRASASGGVRVAGTTLLAVAATVRGVAAAASCAGLIEGAQLVVKRSAEAIAPDAVASTLGMPLVGVVPYDRGLARASAVGLPPGRSARGRWSRAVKGVLDQVIAEAFDED